MSVLECVADYHLTTRWQANIVNLRINAIEVVKQRDERLLFLQLNLWNELFILWINRKKGSKKLMQESRNLPIGQLCYKHILQAKSSL